MFFKIIYNLFLPIGFVFFLPELYVKYRKRGGWKDTYSERFGIFKPERLQELKEFHNCIWIHAVSVGETVVAMSLINGILQHNSQQKIVISTTTTTGQELARKLSPLENVSVIFCPIDFLWTVNKTFDIIKPSMLIIFETEIWPNIISVAKKRNIPRFLVNGRMSDKSARGYKLGRFFFSPILKMFSAILVQTQMDKDRFLAVCPQANVEVTGNIKFDQKVPENLEDAQYNKYFGNSENIILLGASTHPGEDDVIATCYLELAKKYKNLKLVLVPRHAERGGDILEMLFKKKIKCYRKSLGEFPDENVDVLLADTTGEMLKLINGADIVIMGKSLAGHDEGHNLIEPAILGKAVVTGSTLRNFRLILKLLEDANGILTVKSDEQLYEKIDKLLSNEEYKLEIGNNAKNTILSNAGAVDRTISKILNIM